MGVELGPQLQALAPDIAGRVIVLLIGARAVRLRGLAEPIEPESAPVLAVLFENLNGNATVIVDAHRSSGSSDDRSGLLDVLERVGGRNVTLTRVGAS